ncbi:MAG: hypothetical protein LBQ82_00530 [Treponema sp.]|jgi:uncharacterized protein (DUF4415 family)|nr:hypothetical protein [Treponema sp.]
MGMVRVTLNGDETVTEEGLKRMAAIRDRPIDYSDIPEMTDKEVEELRRQIAEGRRNREMFSLRLHNGTIEWWRKNIGAGYTTVMAQLLDEARKHPEWIEESLKSR